MSGSASAGRPQRPGRHGARSGWRATPLRWAGVLWVVALVPAIVVVAGSLAHGCMLASECEERGGVAVSTWRGGLACVQPMVLP